jgi:hypothetical protein
MKSKGKRQKLNSRNWRQKWDSEAKPFSEFLKLSAALLPFNF